MSDFSVQTGPIVCSVVLLLIVVVMKYLGEYNLRYKRPVSANKSIAEKDHIPSSTKKTHSVAEDEGSDSNDLPPQPSQDNIEISARATKFVANKERKRFKPVIKNANSSW